MVQDTVAIIPARGGSKRLPGKNKKSFFGKPMIQYSIEAAQKSGLFHRVIISTDDSEVSEIARALGAEAPFVRPSEISDDRTPLPDVLAHTLEWLKANDQREYSQACLILATAPFVQISHLKKGLELLQRHDVKSVIPVATFSYPILRALKRGEGDRLSMFWPEHEFTRSNDLPEAYHDAGQFYWVNIEKFKKDPRLLLPDAMALPIPRHYVQDIDTSEDWARAEKIFTAFQAE